MSSEPGAGCSRERLTALKGWIMPITNVQRDIRGWEVLVLPMAGRVRKLTHIRFRHGFLMLRTGGSEVPSNLGAPGISESITLGYLVPRIKLQLFVWNWKLKFKKTKAKNLREKLPLQYF